MKCACCAHAVQTPCACRARAVRTRSCHTSGKRQIRQPAGQRSGASLPSWQAPAATRASQSSSRSSQKLSRRPARSCHIRAAPVGVCAVAAPRALTWGTATVRSCTERITPTPDGPSAQRVQLCAQLDIMNPAFASHSPSAAHPAQSAGRSSVQLSSALTSRANWSCRRGWAG